jgi:hypothetical protein
LVTDIALMREAADPARRVRMVFGIPHAAWVPKGALAKDFGILAA